MTQHSSHVALLLLLVLCLGSFCNCTSIDSEEGSEQQQQQHSVVMMGHREGAELSLPSFLEESDDNNSTDVIVSAASGHEHCVTLGKMGLLKVWGDRRRRVSDSPNEYDRRGIIGTVVEAKGKVALPIFTKFLLIEGSLEYSKLYFDDGTLVNAKGAIAVVLDLHVFSCKVFFRGTITAASHDTDDTAHIIAAAARRLAVSRSGNLISYLISPYEGAVRSSISLFARQFSKEIAIARSAIQRNVIRKRHEKSRFLIWSSRDSLERAIKTMKRLVKLLLLESKQWTYSMQRRFVQVISLNERQQVRRWGTSVSRSNAGILMAVYNIASRAIAREIFDEAFTPLIERLDSFVGKYSNREKVTVTADDTKQVMFVVDSLQNLVSELLDDDQRAKILSKYFHRARFSLVHMESDQSTSVDEDSVTGPDQHVFVDVVGEVGAGFDLKLPAVSTGATITQSLYALRAVVNIGNDDERVRPDVLYTSTIVAIPLTVGPFSANFQLKSRNRGALSGFKNELRTTLALSLEVGGSGLTPVEILRDVAVMRAVAHAGEIVKRFVTNTVSAIVRDDGSNWKNKLRTISKAAKASFEEFFYSQQVKKEVIVALTTAMIGPTVTSGLKAKKLKLLFNFEGKRRNDVSKHDAPALPWEFVGYAQLTQSISGKLPSGVSITGVKAEGSVGVGAAIVL
jgi:hypothetical protein